MARGVIEYRKKKNEEKQARKKFGLFFRHQRELLGMSQIDMAILLDITQGTVSKVEAGTMILETLSYIKFKKEFELETDDWTFTEFTEEEMAERGIRRRKVKPDYLKSA